jgi:hypothetical protein
MKSKMLSPIAVLILAMVHVLFSHDAVAEGNGSIMPSQREPIRHSPFGAESAVTHQENLQGILDSTDHPVRRGSRIKETLHTTTVINNTIVVEKVTHRTGKVRFFAKVFTDSIKRPVARFRIEEDFTVGSTSHGTPVVTVTTLKGYTVAISPYFYRVHEEVLSNGEPLTRITQKSFAKLDDGTAVFRVTNVRWVNQDNRNVQSIQHTYNSEDELEQSYFNYYRHTENVTSQAVHFSDISFIEFDYLLVVPTGDDLGAWYQYTDLKLKTNKAGIIKKLTATLTDGRKIKVRVRPDGLKVKIR